MKKKITMLLLTIFTVFTLTACEMPSQSVNLGQTNEDQNEDITYLVMMYDNQGNNFLNFESKQFEIKPNRVIQWGYNTSGSWTSYYETSSIVTVNVDSKSIESCGSTILFKDTRLNMISIPKEIDIANLTDKATVSGNNDADKENNSMDSAINGTTDATKYTGLKDWWANEKAAGQKGNKIVLIQSQDGYNVGAFVGDDIQWKLAGKLPKTTKIVIDDKQLYVHRCNFTILDTGIIENAQ